MANYGKNGLFLNRGDGHFDDASAAWGIHIDSRYDSCAFADFDNDGRLDVYVNGTVTGGMSYRDYLFRNTGSRFEDIGIRMALGAGRGNVIGMVMRESLILVAIGVVIGVGVAVAASRLVTSLLFGLAPTDSITILLAVSVMALVSALAGYLPARTASRVDPMIALRYE